MIIRLTCFWLLAILLTGVLAPGFVFLQYESNKAYITSTLCENRFDVSSDCEGRCYLNKQLKKQEKQQEQLLKSDLLKKLFFEEVVRLTTQLEVLPFYYDKQYYSVYTASVLEGYGHLLVPPPVRFC